MLARGSSLTYDVSGTAAGWLSWSWPFVPALSPGTLRAATLTKLSGAGLIVGRFDLTDTAGVIPDTFSFLATVTVTTTSDHASAADVLSTVRGAFWEVTGYEPLVTTHRQPALQQPAGILPGLNLSLGLLAVIAVSGLLIFTKVRP